MRPCSFASAITSLLPRRNAQLHKQKKQRVIRKRITLCFLVKPFLHKFGVNVVSNHPNAVDKRRGINAFNCLRKNSLAKAFFDKVGCFLSKLLNLLLRFALKHNSYERFCTRNSYKYSSALTQNILNAVYLLCNI